jgi:hypothetical protein
VPRGAYVDPDELRDLRSKSGLRSYIPARVDIEKPGPGSLDKKKGGRVEEVDTGSVLLFKKLHLFVKQKLAVHFLF